MVKQVISVVVVIIVAVCAAWPFVKSNKPSNVPVATIDSKTAISVDKKEDKVVTRVESPQSLPDFTAFKDVKTKKREFFGYLKPMVQTINQEIRNDRAYILALTSPPINKNDKEKLNRLLKKYRVKNKSSFKEQRQALLRRADNLPVELVLMQAANESAWGTSRFATEANNLFGQWCFKPGCGVVPEGRPEGKTYEVRKFNKPIESIRSYFHNLNTGFAYAELRTLRQTLRSMNEELDPYLLAEGLTKYSTRREEYVDEIQNMIRVNKKYI